MLKKAIISLFVLFSALNGFSQTATKYTVVYTNGWDLSASATPPALPATSYFTTTDAYGLPWFPILPTTIPLTQTNTNVFEITYPGETSSPSPLSDASIIEDTICFSGHTNLRFRIISASWQDVHYLYLDQNGNPNTATQVASLHRSGTVSAATVGFNPIGNVFIRYYHADDWNYNDGSVEWSSDTQPWTKLFSNDMCCDLPTLTSNDISCAGANDGFASVQGQNGIPPYDYVWTDSPGTIIHTETNILGASTLSSLSANNYTVSVTDDNGCAQVISISINEPDSLTSSLINLPDVSCFGLCDGQIELSGVGGTAPYTYDIGLGPTSSGNIAGLCPSNYSATIEDSNGCQLVVPFDINEPDTLISILSSTDATCNFFCNGEINLTISGGSPGYSYQWSGPTGFTSVSEDITSLCAGLYTVNVTDSSGCMVTLSEQINDPNPLTITFSTFNPSCAGACDGTAIVIPAGGTVAAGYNYSWSSGIAGNVPNATGICPGTYDLTVTDDNGCPADTLGWNILGPPAVTFSSVIFTDETCNGSCDGTITVASASATQYSFNGGAFAPTSAFNGLCSGTYTITAADANGCSIDTTVTIGSPPAVNLTASPDTTICIGGTATITATASGGVGGFNYIWDSGDLTATINVSPAINQAYCVTVTDANGCPAPAAACVNINLNPALQVTALSVQGICPGDVASISAIATGGDGNYSYTWDNGIGPGQTQNVAPGSTTVYTVTVTDGCETPSASDDLTITVNPLPTIDFTPDVTDGCTPVEVNFAEAGQPTGSQCFWDFGDGNASVNCGIVSNTYTDPGCYDVTLTVISDMGCTDQLTFPNLICVYPYPNAAFSFGPQPTSVMNTEIVFTNESTGATTYNWEFGTDGILGSSGQTNPSFTFPEDNPGAYQICLTATTDYGCQDSICQLVVIDEEFIVYVPNAFSPNDDNVNELFTPVVIGADPLNYKFMVFNRWGELIFDSQIIGQGWDGKYGGIPVQQDVCVWKLIVSNKANGEKKWFTGNVSILK
ncbi:PKD domain-containing protein [Flavobacteriales bacterium]|nr:PKD domain-containing protein [Flavobacteriales bacterium]